ncbi:MAG: adenylate kinase [Chloroflexi bacterium]|nr:adenylate kinase [Chloroflexota bacterium]MCI0788507.1 adenylate kinase [Chloroflexota bacterium]MCI0800452.1 adenylate kinase [Chloroflexota bacterium]MCI0810366.1 adenylate kinase [Chloroflexota bacterium]MCI0847458.1 adenylate kinase [Chloroflexota bacterium]
MAQGLRLVLFGPPGAGKGTQAQLLTDRLKVVHISSGDLFRHHVCQGTPLGLRAKEYMNRGELVPDEVTIDVILDKVQSIPAEDGFILDGFPRNTNQAEELEKKLAAGSRILDKVVHIDVSEPELLRRLGGRFVCRACQAPHAMAEGEDASAKKCGRCGGELYQRDDDAPASVKKRIDVYNKETMPVLGFYRERGVLVDISGDDTVDEVNKQVLAALGV